MTLAPEQLREVVDKAIEGYPAAVRAWTYIKHSVQETEELDVDQWDAVSKVIEPEEAVVATHDGLIVNLKKVV